MTAAVSIQRITRMTFDLIVPQSEGRITACAKISADGCDLPLQLHFTSNDAATAAKLKRAIVAFNDAWDEFSEPVCTFRNKYSTVAA